MNRRPNSSPNTVAVRGVVVFLLFGLTPGVPAAQTAPRQQAEELAQRATAQVQMLQAEAERLARDERVLLVELARLEAQRTLQRTELRQIDVDLAQNQTELDEVTRRLDEHERAVREQRPMVAARLREIYKLGRPGYLRLLLSVGDMRSIGRAYRTLAAVVHLDQQRLDTHRQMLDQLDSERRDLVERAARGQALQRDARLARDRLDRAVTVRSGLVRRIDARRDQIAQLTGQLQVAQRTLQQTMATLAAGRTPPADSVSLPIRPFRGQIDWPAAGQISRGFRTPRLSQVNPSPVDAGVELTVPTGAPVHAVHDGRVTFVDTYTGLGTLVIIEHVDGAQSLYGYLASALVHPGDRVGPQDVLGFAGQAPGGQPAVYFELRIDGEPVDPLQWLKPRSQ